MQRVHRKHLGEQSELTGKIHCKDLAAPMLVGEMQAGDSRTQLFTISDDQVDNEGDRFNTAGWELDVYETNPIVLFNHDYAQPIGKSLSTYIEGKSLKALAWFLPPELGQFGWFADSVWRMVKAKILQTTSVGYLPFEFDVANDRKSAVWPVPLNYKRQRLLEFSIAPVPANPNALADKSLVKTFGIDMRHYHGWVEKHLDSTDEQLDLSFLQRNTLEQIHAITKSMVPRTTRATSANQESSMSTTKAGKVLSAKNVAYLKEMGEHHDKAMKSLADLHKCMKAMGESTMEAGGAADSDSDNDNDGDTDKKALAAVTAELEATKTKAADLEAKLVASEQKNTDAAAAVAAAKAATAATPPAPAEVSLEDCDPADLQEAYDAVLAEACQNELDRQRGRV